MDQGNIEYHNQQIDKFECHIEEIDAPEFEGSDKEDREEAEKRETELHVYVSVLVLDSDEASDKDEHPEHVGGVVESTSDRWPKCHEEDVEFFTNALHLVESVMADCDEGDHNEDHKSYKSHDGGKGEAHFFEFSFSHIESPLVGDASPERSKGEDEE